MRESCNKCGREQYVRKISGRGGKWYEVYFCEDDRNRWERPLSLDDDREADLIVKLEELSSGDVGDLLLARYVNLSTEARPGWRPSLELVARAACQMRSLGALADMDWAVKAADDCHTWERLQGVIAMAGELA